MRSAILNALSTSWVTTTTVISMASRRRRIISSRAAEMTGSRPAEGSSKNSSLGSMMMARATAARLSMPPESSAGISSPKPDRLTTSSFIRTMMSMVFSSSLVCSRSGSLRFSATVMELNMAPPWKATPILRRRSMSSLAPRRPMSRPSNSRLPALGCSRPMRWRSKVLLPEPLAPMMTMISPS